MAKDNKKYHDLMSELDDVMDKLQNDGLDVDDAVDLYQRGLKLTEQLTKYLTESENTLTELKQGK